ncbi:uncharacterized protein LOC119721261 [Patiria miniata]|uniref:Uncharacterized protein n=1 Tax=Patiria miniata TaxID=46514 RepID=A0A913Z5U1_PATMI|nr:uncharacterized protein LOC119721261 [Patiria miniata]
MPRRKRKGSSRKRPLVFTESPVEVSRRFPSPVFAARNPVTADLVAVHEQQQLWVSPQIDPNAPRTPRRCRARRNKTACALDPLMQTQRRKEIVQRETTNHFTSLRFLKAQGDKAANWLTAARATESTDSSSETSTDSTPTDVDETSREGAQKQTRSAEKRRTPLGEIGIAGRTRAQRRRSQSESSRIVDRAFTENWQNNAGLASVSDAPGNNYNQCTRVAARQKENKSGRGDSDKLSSNQVKGENMITSDDDNTCRMNLITDKRKSHRTLQKHVVTTTSRSDEQSCRNTRGSTRNGRNCHSRFLLSETSSDSDTKSSKLQVARLCEISTSDDTDAGTGRDTSQQRQRRAKKTATKARILAYDTPEAEYGMSNSLRHRLKLLPEAARNKLMLCL